MIMKSSRLELQADFDVQALSKLVTRVLQEGIQSVLKRLRKISDRLFGIEGDIGKAHGDKGREYSLSLHGLPPRKSLIGCEAHEW